MRPLEGRVAVVSGASRGLGRAIALRLGGDGASVVVNYHESKVAAEDVVRAIEAAGSRAVAYGADVRSVDQVKRLVREGVRAFGRLDVLVNNAGGGLATKLHDVTPEEFDERFAFNARSAFFAMQEAAVHMGPGGRIINVSATVTRMRVAGAMVYAGAKGAMEQFSRHAALELGERGITVNTVSPGGVATDVFKAHAPEAQRKAATASPLGRMGTPEDVADVVAFLASEASRWVTGQNLCVDGGAGT